MTLLYGNYDGLILHKRKLRCRDVKDAVNTTVGWGAER